MSFLATLEAYGRADIADYLAGVGDGQVQRALAKESLGERDYLALLSPAAGRHLEAMAQRANALTRQHFGSCIGIFTPLYISNYCVNRCRYCAFAAQHRIQRRHLSVEAIRAEAKALSASGIRHILVLTGEARAKAPPAYLAEAVRVISESFSAIGIEVYAMEEGEYAGLIAAGVDTLTIYQETYDRGLYGRLHAGGPKADFAYRLEAPERACRAGMRGVSVGALLGLAEPRVEAFFTGLHAAWLQRRFPGVEVAASFPRMRPFEGDAFAVEHDVDDRLFVQLMTAFRIYLPRVGITVSTRERAAFRDRLARLGATRMSAGVSTAVGHDREASTAQFEIADTRSAEQLRADLEGLGYQAVMHDWSSRLLA